MNTEQKTFKKIVRAERMTQVLEENKDTLGEIVVMEKIDGANASFTLDKDGKLRYFSRRRELFIGDDGLVGFVQWVNNNVDVSKLEKDKVYFGEWTTSHKLDYGENHKKFFLFDIFDINEEEYTDISEVIEVADKLKISHAPIFYSGEFQDMEHLESLVGKSELGDIGEGIVVKFNDFKYRSKKLYLKMVSEQFSEVGIPKSRKRAESIDEIVLSTNTVARAEKMLHKMIDENLLSQDELVIENMGQILKATGKKILADILEEEMATFEHAISKKLLKQIPTSVKQAVLNIENNSNVSEN